MTDSNSPIAIVDGWVDRALRTVLRGESVLQLTELELRILSHLEARAPECVSTDELLQQVWGYARPARTRAVHTAVQRLRRKVELNPSEPTLILTIHGEGFRYVQPKSQGSLLGRGQEVHALQQLASCALLTITGLVGVGKSTLARYLLEQRLDWVAVEVSSVCDSETFWSAVGQALGQEPRTDLEARARVIDSLRCERPMGLFFDNCDGIDACLHEALTELMQIGVQLLLTRRSPLGLPAEKVFRLSPFSPEASLQLIWSVGGLDGAPSEQDLVALNQLVSATGGIPLALSLIGSYLPTVPATELGSMLVHDLLQLRDAKDSGAHRSVAAAIQTAVKLLEAPIQEALVRLAVFRASFEVKAAAAVLECELSQCALVLRSLHSHCMLEKSTVSGRARFALSVPIAAWISETSAGAAEEQRARHMHAAWFGRLGERASLTGLWSGENGDGHGLQRQLSDLDAAFDWSLRMGEPKLVVRLCRACCAAAGARADSVALRAYLRRAWDAECLDEAGKRALVSTLATLRQIDLVRSLDGLDARLPTWQEAHAAETQAATVLRALSLNGQERAEGFLALAQGLGQGERELALRLHVLGASAAMQSRDYGLVEDHLQAGLPLADHLGDARSGSTLLYTQMRLHRARGELHLAERTGARGVRIAEEAGMAEDAFVCRVGMAYLSLVNASASQVIERFRPLLSEARRLGLSYYTHQIDATVCSVLLLSRRTEEAERSAERMRALARIFQAPQCIRQAWWATGACALQRGESLAAHIAFQRALDAGGSAPLIELYDALSQSLSAPVELREHPGLQLLLPFGRGLFWTLYSDVAASQGLLLHREEALVLARRQGAPVVLDAVRERS